MNVIINNDKIERFIIHTKDDYINLLKYFVDNESRGKRSIEEVLNEEIDLIPNESGIVIVVNNFTDRLEEELNIKAQDKNIKFKVICNKKRDVSDGGNVALLNVTELSSYVS